MKKIDLAGLSLCAALMLSTGAAVAQRGYGPGQYQGQGGWDAPPGDFHSDAQRQGFRDGIQAARHDFEAHRQLNVDAHPELRHPPVDYRLRDDYRDGFHRGYDVAVHHLMEQPRPGPGAGYAPPPPTAWDQPPAEFRSDIQRQGFHAGVEAARHDFEAHRRPDFNDHEEFRHPPVPPPAQGDFRESFRRGYTVAVEHMSGH